MPSIYELLQRAEGRGSRSTVMTPLGWLAAIEFAGLGVALRYNAPAYVVQWIVGLLVVTVGAFIVVYVYFAKTAPDSLRSERFFLSKLAIEKSSKGDDVFGLVVADEVPTAVPGTTTPKLPSGEA